MNEPEDSRTTVATIIDMNDEVIDKTVTLLESLRSRLIPVLRSGNPVETVASSDEEEFELGSRLINQRSRVEEVNRILSDLLDRIAL